MVVRQPDLGRLGWRGDLRNVSSLSMNNRQSLFLVYRKRMETAGQMLKIAIRHAGQGDFQVLAKITFAAVHAGHSLYTAEQRLAWMPDIPNLAAWDARLSSQSVLIAETDQILGFLSLTQLGYIDLAFVAPEFQGQGVFGLIYSEIEAIAMRQGLTYLSTHASLMAQSAFSKVGYLTENEEFVELRGQKLKRFKMGKRLG